MIYLLMLTQQLCIPGLNQLPLVAILPFFILAVRFYKGDISKGIKVDFIGMIVLFVGVAIGLLNIGIFSQGRSTSLIYFLILYLIYFSGIFEFDSKKAVRQLINSAIVLGALGLLQWGVQRIGGPYLDLEGLLPDFIVMDGYNFHYPIEYGSPYEKSNGFFCLEPSFYSQFIALAILFEFLGARRYSILLFLLLAYLPSYSGTGFLILAVAGIGFAVEYISEFNIRNIVLSAASIFLLIILSYLFIDFSEFDLFARSGELESDGSSGHLRFVAPLIFYREVLFGDDLQSFFVGIGPGLTDSLIFTMDANFTAYIKVSLEYGFIYGLVFSLFMVLRLGGEYSKPIKFGLLAFYFLASGALLQPLAVYLVAFLSQSKPENKSNVSF